MANFFSPNMLLKKSVEEMTPEQKAALEAQNMLQGEVPTEPGYDPMQGAVEVKDLAPQKQIAQIPAPVEEEPIQQPPEQAAMLEQQQGREEARQAKVAQEEAYAAEQARWNKLTPEQQQSESKANQIRDMLKRRDGAVDEMRAMAEDRMGVEQAGIDDYQKNINDFEGQQQGYDLRPIAGLVDQWAGGGNALQKAAQATAPQSQAERRKQLAAMKAQLSAMKGGLSKSQYDVMKAQLDSYNNEIKLYASENLARERMRSTDSRFDRTKVSELSKRIETVPELSDKLRRITELVPDTGSLSGVGVGEKAFKDFMLSTKGKAIQQDAKDILSDVMRLKSGLTVTDSERKMISEIQGLTFASSETTFRRGIKNLQDFVIKRVEAVERGYDNNVRSAWKANGGQLSQDYRLMFERARKKANESAGGLSADEKRLKEIEAQLSGEK